MVARRLRLGGVSGVSGVSGGVGGQNESKDSLDAFFDNSVDMGDHVTASARRRLAQEDADIDVDVDVDSEGDGGVVVADTHTSSPVDHTEAVVGGDDEMMGEGQDNIELDLSDDVHIDNVVGDASVVIGGDFRAPVAGGRKSLGIGHGVGGHEGTDQDHAELDEIAKESIMKEIQAGINHTSAVIATKSTQRDHLREQADKFSSEYDTLERDYDSVVRRLATVSQSCANDVGVEGARRLSASELKKSLSDAKDALSVKLRDTMALRESLRKRNTERSNTVVDITQVNDQLTAANKEMETLKGEYDTLKKSLEVETSRLQEKKSQVQRDATREPQRLTDLKSKYQELSNDIAAYDTNSAGRQTQIQDAAVMKYNNLMQRAHMYMDRTRLLQRATLLVRGNTHTHTAIVI
eukprot:GFYU01001035.1.p1 GENE.GFYU01001035.1~~GFYU01001035.1.p1  ORF type:complete len:408 (-),score=163.06 GFYU01001035.1:497-1720(-)